MSEMGGRTDLQEKGERVEKNMGKKTSALLIWCVLEQMTHTLFKLLHMNQAAVQASCVEI